MGNLLSSQGVRPLRPLAISSGRNEKTEIQAENPDIRPLRPLRPERDSVDGEFPPLIRHDIVTPGVAGGICGSSHGVAPRSVRSGRNRPGSPTGKLQRPRPQVAGECTEWPTYPRPLPWRSVTGSWPLPLRQRWGDLANELDLAGVPWPDHEAEAFRRVCEEARPEELP
jgi:hypothetical protein